MFGFRLHSSARISQKPCGILSASQQKHIPGDGSYSHLVKVASEGVLHKKSVILPIKINKHLVGRYFETM